MPRSTYSGYELGQHEPTCETICRLAELYRIETDFIIGKGFVDPYSDDITEHYFQCKGFNDLGMENITKTMNAIAAEADKVEKSRIRKPPVMAKVTTTGDIILLSKVGSEGRAKTPFWGCL